MSERETSARALGFRAVGEWEPNEICYCAWPAHEYAWFEFLAAAQREFVGFCRALLADSESERLELLVPDARAELDAKRALAELAERVRFRRLAYGDVWLRDTTPLFVRGPHGLGCVRFDFNGWGEKFAYPGDAELAARLCEALALPSFVCRATLEGGALELDGEGTCLTTESCLLNPNRGPSERAALEAELRAALAVDKVLWLREGLAGDHTDGHIDNLARFVAPGVVMHMRAEDDDDPNRETLRAIETSLRSFTDARGRRLELVPIPSPGRILDANREPMAASYLNFYLGNRVVIVPAFGSERDERARRTIARAFPSRRTVSAPARAILEGGGGTFHCMTRQQPMRSGTPELGG